MVRPVAIVVLAFAASALAACASEPGSRPGGDRGAAGADAGNGAPDGSGAEDGGVPPDATGSAGACQPSFDGTVLKLAIQTALAPGAERTMCYRWTAQEDLSISWFQGTLGPTGHHALLISHGQPSGPDGLSECNEAELMDSRTEGLAAQLVSGVSYETSGLRYDFPAYPIGASTVQIGLRVPAGAQLILDGHFLNASSSEQNGCTTIALGVDRPVDVPLEFRTLLAREQYTLAIPAHDSLDVTYQFPAQDGFRVAAAMAHMHSASTLYRLSVRQTGQVLYETTEWSEPTPALFDQSVTVVEAGQTLQVDCSFTNTTDTERRFPDEMCVGALYVLPCSFPLACP